MPTECSQDSLDFGTVAGRQVVACFDGGAVTSDSGALLLGQTDKAIGYEDLNDHDDLRRPGLDPGSGNGSARRQACGAAERLCTGGRQVDAEPARAGAASPPTTPQQHRRPRAASPAAASHAYCTARSTNRSRNRCAATLCEKAGLNRKKG